MFDSCADLVQGEIDLLRTAVQKHGRVMLLVPDAQARESCRRALAHAGLGLGVEVTLPGAWIESLWDVFGDGRHIVSRMQRRLLVDNTLASCSDSELAPLRDNPGTRGLLARAFSDLLPYLRDLSEGDAAGGPGGSSHVRLRELAARYGEALSSRGLIEASCAATLLAEQFAEEIPLCASCVVVRGVDSFSAYLLGLLACVARAGSLAVLLPAGHAAFARELSDALGALDCEVAVSALPAPASARRVPHEFIEVAGPHARARAHADRIVELARAAGRGREVAVVAPRAAQAFDELAPYLAARGVHAACSRTVGFAESETGRQFTALASVVARMKESSEGSLSRAEWWPAPELTDWLYSPLSGALTFDARRFDKKIRSKRELDAEAVLSELQRVQTKIMRERKDLPEDHQWAGVPVVCADVVNHIWRERPVSALKAMRSVAQVAPQSMWGMARGWVAPLSEVALADRAIELLMDTARVLDVPQRVAVQVFDELRVRQPQVMQPLGSAGSNDKTEGDGAAAEISTPMAEVRFLTLREAAECSQDAFAAALFIDVDVSSYPLSREEGIVPELAAALDAEGISADPASRQRFLFEGALRAVEGTCAFARVTHDRQAKENYPAAIWTELAARAQDASHRTVGEGDVVGDLDCAASEGMETQCVSCMPPQQLSEEALPYLVPRRRDTSQEGAPLVPRQFSASQIESYAGCPLCWFMSSRVRPASLDAGFGNMEKGNFVHDVLFRFHERLQQEGTSRVTAQNLEASLCVLREVFDEVRREHARGKTSSSAPLVPLDHSEELEVADILPQLERVVRYESEALAPFAPAYLEYSFNGLGVTYAGVPLGGRIDRVDVDAEGRAVVIDYKHRGDVNPFRLKDPTVPLKSGEVPADDEHWLPEHTQTLIYAQAIKRALGLDARGALYFSTKGTHPAMRGAVSAELAEEFPGDGRVPGLKDGFPAEAKGGTMTFEELLDRTERQVGARLEELFAGRVSASENAAARHEYNHPLGFERRGA